MRGLRRAGSREDPLARRLSRLRRPASLGEGDAQRAATQDGGDEAAEAADVDAGDGEGRDRVAKAARLRRRQRFPFVDPLTMQEEIVWLTAKVELRVEDPLVREVLREYPEDWFVRFVRGAMYEADAAARVRLAKRSIARSVHWRRKNGIDRILEWPFPAVRTFRDKVWPMRVLGMDSDGHLVLVLRLAECDWDAAAREIDKTDLLELMAMYQEALTVYMRTAGARCTQVLLVDCTGLTWKDFRTAINHGLSSIFSMWSRHYPYSLHALYLLHCPVVVKALFRAVRAWIEPDTLSKVNLLSGGSAAKASSLYTRCGLPLDHIPRSLGGTAEEEDAIGAFVLSDTFIDDKAAQRCAFRYCRYSNEHTRRARASSGDEGLRVTSGHSLHQFSSSSPDLVSAALYGSDDDALVDDLKPGRNGAQRANKAKRSLRNAGEASDEEEYKEGDGSGGETASRAAPSIAGWRFSPRSSGSQASSTAPTFTQTSLGYAWWNSSVSSGRASPRASGRDLDVSAATRPLSAPALAALSEACDELWPLRGKTLDLLMWEDPGVTVTFIFSAHLLLGLLRILRPEIVVLAALLMWSFWSAFWTIEAIRCRFPTLYLVSSDLSSAWKSVILDLGAAAAALVDVVDHTLQGSRRNRPLIQVVLPLLLALVAVLFVDIVFIAHGALIGLFFFPSLLKLLLF